MNRALGGHKIHARPAGNNPPRDKGQGEANGWNFGKFGQRGGGKTGSKSLKGKTGANFQPL